MAITADSDWLHNQLELRNHCSANPGSIPGGTWNRDPWRVSTHFFFLVFEKNFLLLFSIKETILISSLSSPFTS